MAAAHDASGRRTGRAGLGVHYQDKISTGIMEQCEQQWIEDIRAGDEAAFEEMFRAYYPKLCRFAAEYVDSANRARDLVQDVFLRIWERREEWGVRRSLKAYLYQSVRNRALNQARNEDTKKAVEDDLEYTTNRRERRTATDAIHANTLSDEVEEAIQALPERRRMAFLLHRRHGLTYKEIACAMDITTKTVENQIGRALKTLRDELAPLFSHRL
jgi:RNA polymerase sigma-70 factor (ECF subfamily)